MTKNFTKTSIKSWTCHKDKSKQVCNTCASHRQVGRERELTPVTAVPAHAQAMGRRYHGAFEIRKRPKAYEVTDIRTDAQAFTSSISNT